MAVDCVNAFNNSNTLIRQLVSDTQFGGSIANQFVGAFYRFEMIEFETVYFYMGVQPKTTAGIHVEFTLYRKDGAVFTNLGTSVSDEFNNTFEYSAQPGAYYICITSSNSVDYTLSADFTDFPFVAITDAVGSSGAYMPPFDFAQPESFCDSPVYYEILEGELPTGLTMDGSGVIQGIPLEQDCEPNALDENPSFTWWEELPDGTRKAVGLKHRLLIRAALVDDPSVYHDREFFVCVHNNWDYDRDSFIASAPGFETMVYEIEGEESWMEPPKVAPEPPNHITDQLSSALCPAGEQPAPEPLTLEQIKELTKQVYIAPEYAGLVEIADDGLCRVCEPAPAPPVSLQPITEVFCTPCGEPAPVEYDLKPLPKSMCPFVVESTEMVNTKPKFVEGIPEICYPDLIERMINNKVCVAYHKCLPQKPLYKESKKPIGDLLPKTMCE